jgi:phage terminase large subunit-like protein
VLPVVGYRGAYGIDLAYTADTTSDESACLEMWRVETKDPLKPLFYVIDIWYDRCLIERTAEIIQGKHASAPAWTMCWRCSGTERGSAMLLKGEAYRLPITIRTVSTDKLVSNTAVAVAWNDGRVLLPDFAAFPEKAERIKRLMNQCLDFTGSGKEHDDLVDSLGNAHVELRGQTGVKTQTAKSASSRATVCPASPGSDAFTFGGLWRLN